MDSLTVAGTVFGCTLGGAFAGMGLRRLLPESHLSPEAKDVVKMGTSLVSTLAALVLGLLIASAKGSFDAQRTGFQQLSVNLILLDRSLQSYGPEAADCRAKLRRTVQLLIDHRWPPDGTPATGLADPELTASGGALYAAIRDLAPRTDAQKLVQSQALGVATDLARTRWTLRQGEGHSIPTALLVVLVVWLTVLFVTFGLFAPPNGTVGGVLVVCAASVAGALFLIVELDRPFDGLIQISSQPLRDALEQFGP